MTIFRAIFLLSTFLAGAVYAEDIVMPRDGRCSNGYMAFDGVCLSEDALMRYSPADLVSKIYEFKAEHRRASPGRGTQVICETEVREKDGDYFKLMNGAVAEKTSYGYIGYVSYGTEALLIYDGTLGSILLEDETLEVEVLRPPSSCDTPSTYFVDAVTSDKVIINDEIFEIWGLCSSLSAGDQIVFSDSSAAYGMCLKTSIYNLSKGGSSCELYCE